MKHQRHAGAWQDYRRRVRGFFIAWLGGFASVAALLVALDALGAPEWAFMLLGLAWMAVFIRAGFRLQRFRCPRCRSLFFSNTFSYWPFARECRHCKHPKWQD